MNKSILLTFDIEEFDLLKQNNIYLKEDIYKISYNGTQKILEFLDKFKINATFFVTAVFAKKYPKLIRKISKNHEIGLHGFSHEDNYKELSSEKSYELLKKAKNIIERIINKKVIGFRAPRFMPPNIKVIKKLKLKYDSSIHPIFLPGHYNNFFKKRKLHKKMNLVIFPVSTTPILRLPLAWIFFRNFGLAYAKLCTKLCLMDQKNVLLIFHPWEFINLNKFKLPFLIKRNTGDKLISLLENYILWGFRKKFNFLTVKKFLYNEK